MLLTPHQLITELSKSTSLSEKSITVSKNSGLTMLSPSILINLRGIQGDTSTYELPFVFGIFSPLHS